MSSPDLLSHTPSPNGPPRAHTHPPRLLKGLQGRPGDIMLLPAGGAAEAEIAKFMDMKDVKSALLQREVPGPALGGSLETLGLLDWLTQTCTIFQI